MTLSFRLWTDEYAPIRTSNERFEAWYEQLPEDEDCNVSRFPTGQSCIFIFSGDEEFYPRADTLIHGTHYPTETAMNRLTEDLDAEAKRRQKFHRRRTFDSEAPVDYINEKNRKFNEKLERYYGEYTSDLKVNRCNYFTQSTYIYQEDLERGTAL